MGMQSTKCKNQRAGQPVGTRWSVREAAFIKSELQGESGVLWTGMSFFITGKAWNHSTFIIPRSCSFHYMKATSKPEISKEMDEMMPAVDGVPQRYCFYALSQACRRRGVTRRQCHVCLGCRLRATETDFFPDDLGQVT